MDLIKIKIEKDENITKYVMMIRRFDDEIPIIEIKRRIIEGEVVITYDLDAYDFISDEFIKGISQYQRERNFLDFLNSLEKAGAKMTIYLNDKETSMQFLNNLVKTREGIRQDLQQDIDNEVNAYI